MTRTQHGKSICILAVTFVAALAFSASNSQAQLVTELGILDLNANGGINPATGAAWADGDTYRLMFTTSMRTPATSSDINFYNAFVQNAANNSTSFSNLGDATWRAIASTATVNARDNTSTNIGVNGTGESTFLLNGSSMVAADYPDLWGSNSNGEVNVNLTENLTTPPQGNAPPANTNVFSSVWTGTYRFAFPGDPNYGTADNSAGGGPLGDGDGVAKGGLWGNNNNGTQWIWRFDHSTNTELPLFALSDPLTVTDMSGGGGPATPVSILSTDFTDRTVSGSTASNIPWVTNGVADPGDLTAATNPDGLFDTADAQGRFAPDRNIHNEGDWSVDIPLSVGSMDIELDTVSLDAFIYNNAGTLQGVSRDVDLMLELLDDMSNVLDSETILDVFPGSGTPTLPTAVSFDLTGNTLTAGDDFILRLTATGQGQGNNAGFDNLNVTGTLVAIPEPASLAIWSLIGLSLAGIGVYRGRRKK